MKSIILGITLCSFLNNYGQTKIDTLIFKKSIFKQNGLVLNINEVLEITKINKDAYTEVVKAKRNFKAAKTLGFLGGLCVGVPIGQLIIGTKPNWFVLGAGAGLIGVAIPINYNFKKHSTTAVKIYNSNFKN